MNRRACTSILAALTGLALGLLTSCSNSSSEVTPKVVATATSGTTQRITVGKKFAKPLAVTVTTGGMPTSGVQVTFTAPSSGASGTFANGTATETDTTDSNGVATSSPFTANNLAGSYTVTAAVLGTSTTALFQLSNTSAPTATTNYSFSLSGLETLNGSDNFYALAGSVAIDTAGNVVAGEQDYNDGMGLTSPNTGDSITGGVLTVDSTTGQGTLTLVTNNPRLGVNGTETLGVQFVNANHALILQLDSSATSSGSLDLQTPTTLSGGYSFALSGVDSKYYPVAFGGVFSINGTSLSNGLLDINDAGTVVTGTAFTGTLSTPDSYGRGTITGTGIAGTLVYYIVGPEAMQIIDVDATDSAVGSAFGQGSSVFTNASLGSSVFVVKTNLEGIEYEVAGMFAVPAVGTFQGVADNDEQGNVWSGTPISGNYSISNTVGGVTYNGYGGLTIASGTLGDFTTLGIYMTDPNLNLSDPNNTTGGGGALVLTLDPYFSGGTAVLIPQTDSATASFAGNYAFGAQDYYTGNPGWEFDFVGQGSVSGGALTGSGLVNDPFQFFIFSPGIYTGVPFSGTANPDPVNAGRYTILLTATAAGASVPFQTVIYQATGGQLFWVEEDTNDVFPNNQVSQSMFNGSLQQQGSLTGLPAIRKTTAKAKRN